MFRPNRTCFMRKGGTYDAYGQAIYGGKVTIQFALVNFNTKTEDSTVRADSSATRGNIKEYHSTGRILVPNNTNITWGDLVIIDKKVFRVRQKEDRYNVLGKFDHIELDLEKAEDLFGDEN